MEIITIGSTLVALGAIGGVLATYYQLKRQFKDELLIEAKNYLLEMEKRIALAEQNLENHKLNHAQTIESLAKKLDDLRDEVRQQHGQLIDLLMKFVPDKRK